MLQQLSVWFSPSPLLKMVQTYLIPVCWTVGRLTRMFPYDLLGWPKGSFVFFHKMALVALSCLKLHSKQFCEIVCDRCHISVHLKKDIKIGEFLCSHLNIKDGRKKQYFRHIMLYYFKKGKNATKMQKRFVQCMEKVLWLIEQVKSGLWSFVLEISR